MSDFMVIPLSNTEPGDTVRIVFLSNEGPMAGRLRDLGFTPGATVSCVLQGRKKNIAAYLVRNAVIALREGDSRLIMAEPVEDSARRQAESEPWPESGALPQDPALPEGEILPESSALSESGARL